MSRLCRTCEKPLGPQNRSGYCKHHVSAVLAADPAWREKQRAAAKQSIYANPDRLAAMRRQMIANGKLPHAVEARRQSCIDRKLWEQGHEKLARDGSEARRRAGERGSATKLAAIPLHLRGQYRELTKLGHRADDAKRMIIEQNELEMKRWRREITGETPPTTMVMIKPLPEPTGGDEIDRVGAMLSVSREEILGRVRTPHLVDARAAIAVLLRGQGKPFAEIGSILGRDHSSVMHLVRTFHQRAARCPALYLVVQGAERLAA
jgi:hypothetical protein